MEQKLTANDVENIKELLSNLVKAELDDILYRANPYIEKIKEIEDQLKIDENFNIFTAIAEKYRHENLHSDLLKVILGNEKNNIGNSEIFSKFLEYIKIKDRENYFSDYDSIKFEREYPIAIPLKSKDEEDKKENNGFIDLLIHDDKACIIIENKINGAPDQPNQLGKYYMHMKIKEKKEVLKIVYLTREQNIDQSIFNKYNFSEYTSEYNNKESIINEINDLLITLPCVTMEHNKKNFTKFLETVKGELDNTTDKNTKEVFIEQYKSLVKSIGGQVLMNEPEKELIKEIMGDQNKIRAAQIFNTTWNRRAGIIAESLLENITDIYSGMRKEDDFYIKEIKETVYLYCASNNKEDNNNIEFGFCSKNSNMFTDETKDELIEILKNLYSKTTIKTEFKFDSKKADKDYIWDKKNENWVWLYHHVSDLGDLTYDDIKEELVKCLSKLEDEARKALKSQKK